MEMAINFYDDNVKFSKDSMIDDGGNFVVESFSTEQFSEDAKNAKESSKSYT